VFQIRRLDQKGSGEDKEGDLVTCLASGLLASYSSIFLREKGPYSLPMVLATVWTARKAAGPVCYIGKEGGESLLHTHQHTQCRFDQREVHVSLGRARLAGALSALTRQGG
jgi:hypothetical protein